MAFEYDLDVSHVTGSSTLEGMDGEQLQRAFRELFRNEVINHGDYTVVCGHTPGPGPALRCDRPRE